MLHARISHYRQDRITGCEDEPDIKMKIAVAAMTILNMDDSIKNRLRIRAAIHGRSMEDEARDIVGAALSTELPQPRDLGQRIHRRFARLDGVDLPLVSREAIRRWISTNDRRRYRCAVGTDARRAGRRRAGLVRAGTAGGAIHDNGEPSRDSLWVGIAARGQAPRQVTGCGPCLFDEDIAGRISPFYTDGAHAYADIASARKADG
jgi:plasmid stability protein